MKRNYFDRGETGNEWLDEAWFTLVIDGQKLEDRRVKRQELYVIKEMLLSMPYFHHADELARLRAIYDELDSGENVFVLAFPRLRDAHHLMALRLYEHARYGAYPSPKTFYEAQSHQLYQRFPMTAHSRVDLVIFAGEDICRHPGFRKNDGGGMTVASATGFRNVALKDWWKHSGYGFEDGLSLVRVTPGTPVYKIEENYVQQLWQESHMKAAPFVKRWVDLSEVNPYAEVGIAKLIEYLHGVKPGEPPQEN